MGAMEPGSKLELLEVLETSERVPGTALCAKTGVDNSADARLAMAARRDGTKGLLIFIGFS
jgi:hypothetical protein